MNESLDACARNGCSNVRADGDPKFCTGCRVERDKLFSDHRPGTITPRMRLEGEREDAERYGRNVRHDFYGE